MQNTRTQRINPGVYKSEVALNSFDEDKERERERERDCWSNKRARYIRIFIMYEKHYRTHHGNVKGGKKQEGKIRNIPFGPKRYDADSRCSMNFSWKKIPFRLLCHA